MDLVLCAVGCMLVFFVIQIIAPRAPGRDDRPLVVSARAFALDPTKQTRFRWRLICPDGRVVAQSQPTGASVHPIDLSTSGRQSILFTIPEPQYGDWALQAIAETEFENVDPVFQGALVEHSNDKGFTSEWQKYFRALNSYHSVRAATIRMDDYRRFEELLETIDPAKIAIANINTHHQRRDSELERYVKYRVLCLRAGFLKRILAEQSLSENDSVQAREWFTNVEAEIVRVLDAIKSHGEQTKIGGDFEPYRAKQLSLALEADEESRRARAGTPDGKVATMAIRPRWEALDDELKTITPPLKTGGAIYYKAVKYFPLRSDWIRWRGAFDYDISPGSTPIKRRLLQEALEFGREDPFMRFIVEEFRIVLRRDGRIGLELGLSWGDAKWPERVAGKSELGLFSGILQSQDGNDGRPIELLKAILERGSDQPRVELATQIQLYKEAR